MLIRLQATSAHFIAEFFHAPAKSMRPWVLSHGQRSGEDEQDAQPDDAQDVPEEGGKGDTPVVFVVVAIGIS